MRHNEYVGEPSCRSKNNSNSVGANLIARDRVLRISEIMTVLGFADTLGDFAERFLGMTKLELEYFLTGHNRCLPMETIAKLKQSLAIAHNTVAGEIEYATDIDEFWAARARYNLVQTAHLYLDEFIEKLA